MMERRHAARWPPESFFRVPQIAHDVSVFPATFLRSRSAQIGRRRRTVVHRTQPITIRAHTRLLIAIGRKTCAPLLRRNPAAIYKSCGSSLVDSGGWTYRWPTSCAATMMPEKPPVSSMIATLLTFSRRLFTTQAPPTYANPIHVNTRISTTEWFFGKKKSFRFFPSIPKRK